MDQRFQYQSKSNRTVRQNTEVTVFDFGLGSGFLTWHEKHKWQKNDEVNWTSSNGILLRCIYWLRTASSQQVRISLTWTTRNTWAVLYSVYILWPILCFVYFLLNFIVLDEGERGEWKSWLKAQRSKNKDHGIQSLHFMPDRWGSNGDSDRLFSCASKSL